MEPEGGIIVNYKSGAIQLQYFFIIDEKMLPMNLLFFLLDKKIVMN
jgi:hypothetical protein